MEEKYLTYAIYGVIILFILIQWFLSLRPFWGIGLVVPILFVVIWYVLSAQPSFIPNGLYFSEETTALCVRICKLSLLFSLAIYALCRLGMSLKKAVRTRRREQRLAEKHRRQEREAALLHEYKQAAGQARRSPYGEI